MENSMNQLRLLNFKNVEIPNELVKTSNKIKSELVIVKLIKVEILRFQLIKLYMKLSL